MTPLSRLVSRAVFPAALLISMSHLFNAEQAPGDGFTAGIISALGLILQYLVFAYDEMRRRIAWLDFEKLLYLGLALALASALLPMLAGEGSFGPLQWSAELPWIGKVSLKRSQLFDVGIYFVVFGGAMTALESFRKADA